MTSKSGMTDDWQESKKTLKDRAAYLLETGVLSDIKFIVGAAEFNKKAVSAHKFVLAMGSSVFATMFYGSMAETKETILVPDITHNAFIKMLKYLYTDLFKVDNAVDALDLYNAANKYMISHLKKECEVYLNSTPLFPFYICHIFERAQLYDIHSLEDRCVTFITTSTRDVIKSEGFLRAKLGTVQMILEMSELSVTTESELFSALLNWGRAESTRHNMTEDSDYLKLCLKPLIPYIRFLTMSIEEFTNAMEEADHMFDCKETLSVYMKIANQNSKHFNNLPSWCNRSVSRRIIPSTGKVLAFLLNKPSTGKGAQSSGTYGMQEITKKFTSTLKVESLHNNFVIMGVKLQWDGLYEKHLAHAVWNNGKYLARPTGYNGKPQMPYYLREPQFSYTVETSNPSTGYKESMNNTVTTEKEVNLNFPNYIYVASGQTAKIRVSVNADVDFEFLQYNSSYASLYKRAEFAVTLKSSSQDRDFVITELIYFV